MSITLNIISYQRLTPGQDNSFSSDSSRFSIGRNPGNDWVLPDPKRFMSGTHCWLEHRDGTWYVTDTSTNGVFVNKSDHRVTKNDSVPIKHGDTLRLGDYELEVDCREVASTGPIADPSRPLDPTDTPFANPVSETEGARARGKVNTPLSQMDDDFLGEAVSIDDLYDLDESDENEPPVPLTQREAASPLRQHFTPPRVEADQPRIQQPPQKAGFQGIGDDWDDETGVVQQAEEPPPFQAQSPTVEPEAPLHRAWVDPASEVPAESPRLTESRPRSPDQADARAGVSNADATGARPVDVPPQPVRPTAADASPATPPRGPGSAKTSALEAFVLGAGLDPARFDVQDETAFFSEIGVLVRTMTAGIMQAIASRSEIKNEFRLEQTTIAPTHNNPFKFSATPEEALARFFGQANSSAYLEGPAAAAEAIDDINAHQLAVLAGTEAALKSILRKFKPSHLESRFDSDSLLAKSVPALRKARYWELYKILYTELAEAAEDDFQQFFGAEFSNAYEKQLDRLKVARKESK